MEHGEQLVEQARGRSVVDPQPHHAQRDPRGHRRQVVHGLEHRLQLFTKGHKHNCHRKREQQRNRHHHRGVNQGVLHGFPEQLVLKGGCIIFQPHKIRAEGLVIFQAGLQRRKQRIDRKHHKEHQGHRNEQVPPQIVVCEKAPPAAQCGPAGPVAAHRALFCGSPRARTLIFHSKAPPVNHENRKKRPA